MIIDADIDGDGYPTDGTLRQIEKLNFVPNLDGLMSDLLPIFSEYGKCERMQDGRWVISTGGWSGCESIINAMKFNHLIWVSFWLRSVRGGYYELAPPEYSDNRVKILPSDFLISERVFLRSVIAAAVHHLFQTDRNDVLKRFTDDQLVSVSDMASDFNSQDTRLEDLYHNALFGEDDDC